MDSFALVERLRHLIEERRQDPVFGKFATVNGLLEQVESSLSVINEAFDRYAENFGFSYNGGKDSLVTLYLIYAVGRQRGLASRPNWLPCVFWLQAKEFPEVAEFVHLSVATFNISVESPAGDFRECLQEFVAAHNLKAIAIGTRRSDPNSSNLTAFSEATTGWPNVMRVHPILEWEYEQIWAFLKLLEIPYCSLYDTGYTSLGTLSNTRRNPELRMSDGSYRPACDLSNGDFEREGRS